ncbi:hypothetical protein AVEN_185552-1 [Araneus ventricosus]|uniref:Uncharacterized protein n=1 Tax=Araneus ventricosus TaxID=182803 RepID=A0A4Y2HD18_ARAVE|nr:hypothetical protein AVEN_185552-1 [Araneus ventricosus]
MFSVHSENCKLFAVTIKKMCLRLSFLMLCCTHYRCLFVRDLEEMSTRIMTLYANFLGGKFTSNCTVSVFSALSNDQFYEQNNKKIKGIGGDIGILENEDHQNRANAIQHMEILTCNLVTDLAWMRSMRRRKDMLSWVLFSVCALNQHSPKSGRSLFSLVTNGSMLSSLLQEALFHMKHNNGKVSKENPLGKQSSLIYWRSLGFLTQASRCSKVSLSQHKIATILFYNKYLTHELVRFLLRNLTIYC